MSCSSVTVNVCGWPTTLVAFGEIGILALTQRFVAGPELPLSAVGRPCQRVAERPRPSSRRSPTSTPGDRRGVGDRAGARRRRRWCSWSTRAAVDAEADDGAVGRVHEPGAGLTLTCAVKVWFAPTRLTPFGVIEMLASTTLSGSHGPSEARVDRVGRIAEVVRAERALTRGVDREGEAVTSTVPAGPSGRTGRGRSGGAGAGAVQEPVDRDVAGGGRVTGAAVDGDEVVHGRADRHRRDDGVRRVVDVGRRRRRELRDDRSAAGAVGRRVGVAVRVARVSRVVAEVVPVQHRRVGERVAGRLKSAGCTV